MVEDALQQHPGLQDVVDRIRARLEGTALPENGAIVLATTEVQASRAQRRAEGR